MNFYTYIHTKPDGTPFYIGKGSGPKRHKSKCGRNTYWKNIVAKYGYEATILAYWETEKEAHNHEELLISCFKDMGYKLANLTNGGEGTTGFKWSDEQKKKRTGNKNLVHGSGEKNPMFGKKRPDLAKRNKEIIRLGESHPNFKGVVVATCLKTGNKLELRGGKEMEAAGFCPGHVSSCVTGKLRTHKQHTFIRI